VSIGLGAVFIYASLDKIAHPLDFAKIVYRYRLAGPTAALGVVPANLFASPAVVEAVIGVLLVTGLWRRRGDHAALLVMFSTAVGYVMWQGIDVGHCGCFMVGGEGRSAGGPGSRVISDRWRCRSTSARPPADSRLPLRRGAGARRQLFFFLPT
jgi:uncharacterized membrane protein YphA (DoxX/SURF4 family)